MTAGGAVTAIACTLQSDGTAAVFYAVAGVVYRITRTGTGAWGTATAWTNSLTSVSGLAAYFEQDHNVLVSGASAAVASAVWACIFGAGGQVAANVWTGLTEVAGAAAGTNVTYLATGVARAETPRAALVEAYSGGGAYQRVHLAAAADGAIYFDQAWREPLPFEVASAHGLGLAAAGSHAWLASPDGVWHATTHGHAATSSPTTCWRPTLQQALEGGRLRLRDAQRRRPLQRLGAAPPALAAGGELWVAPGYATTAGDEASEGSRFWIASVRRRRAREGPLGRRGRCRRRLGPARRLGRAEAARVDGGQHQRLRHRAGAAASRRAPPEPLARQQRERPAQAGLHRARGRVGGDRRAPPARYRARHDAHARHDAAAVRAEAGDAVDYAYGVEHAIHELRASRRAGARRAGRACSATASSREAVDDAALRDGAGTALVVDDNLAVQARADVRATTTLRRQALAVARGEARRAAERRAGGRATWSRSRTRRSASMRAPFRVAALRLRCVRGGPRPLYEMTLSLTLV